MRDRRRVIASSIGVAARQALRTGSGEVIAVFDRSFYVRLRGGLVCVGNGTIGRGPINLLCPALDEVDLRSVVRTGTTVATGAATILLRPVLVDCAETAVWTPPPAPPLDARRVAAGLAALRAALPARVPPGGLADLLRDGDRPATSVERAGAGPISVLMDWVAGCRQVQDHEFDEAVEGLLGLGPGLTPSGDDFLAGMLLALRWARAPRHHRRLQAAISAQAPRLTHEISSAHLAAAAMGRLHADVHEVLAAIGTGEPSAVAAGLNAPSLMMHGSPWDAIAGFAMTLCAMLRPGSELRPEASGQRPASDAPPGGVRRGTTSISSLPQQTRRSPDPAV